MLHLQKYSLSLGTENCIHCAEAGTRKHSDPVKHINVDEVATMCKIQQLSCVVNIQSVDLWFVANTSVQCIEFFADTSIQFIKFVADSSV